MVVLKRPSENILSAISLAAVPVLADAPLGRLSTDRRSLWHTSLAVQRKMRLREGPNWKNGRGERIRTSDPLVPNQVRYQTALRPEYVLR